MVINFKTYKISRDIYKLTRAHTLIKKYLYSKKKKKKKQPTISCQLARITFSFSFFIYIFDEKSYFFLIIIRYDPKIDLEKDLNQQGQLFLLNQCHFFFSIFLTLT
jgi:sensor histidine kinase YesM